MFASSPSGCVPSFEDTPWKVDGPRILVVRGEPAEAEPETSVAFEALYVDATGRLAGGTLAWAYCLTPRPLEERNMFAPECVDPSAIGALVPIDPAAAPLPADACSRFGPSPPPTAPGAPPGRSADPDSTGGYYQPMVVSTGAVTAVALQRLSCDLAGAPADVAVEFRQRYELNTNPAAPSAARETTTGVVDLLDGPLVVGAGETVRLRAAWAPLDAEPYLSYDPESASLVDRREAMTVSWFVTTGRISSHRTGVVEADAASVFESWTEWTAPTSPASGTMWIVLRDSRGGSSWREVVLEAQ